MPSGSQSMISYNTNNRIKQQEEQVKFRDKLLKWTRSTELQEVQDPLHYLGLSKSILYDA
jgi:hypothetical protein